MKNVLKDLKREPSKYLVIHYSSESLFDEVENAYSPRITSIVVMFFENRQTKTFSLHAIAEELNILRENVVSRNDDIERVLLDRFCAFAKSNFDKCWLHWNMRNTVFGFEHLEHRYRVLVKQEPPTIPVDNRVNVSDILKYNYGSDFAPDPRMLKLMELNGRRDPRFLSGQDESTAFKKQEFIRMNSSTISKVEFFGFVLDRAAKGKLVTAGRSLIVRLDRALETRFSRIVALISAFIGILGWVFFLVSFIGS
ncbi:hypothetical protein [Yoonia sp.]|uniref:hypothetical protein n=1 Tax=Yoonia sp. TaxID=2212373 RepID=UPI003A4D97A8